MKTSGRWLATGTLLAGTAVSALAELDTGDDRESDAERVARQCVYRSFETMMGDNMAFVRVNEHARGQRWIDENPSTFSEVTRWIGASEEFAIKDEHQRGLEVEALLRECRDSTVEQLAEAASASLSVAITQPRDMERLTRFMLYNECQPVGLLVDDSEDTLSDAGLTEHDVRDLAEQRLRNARLYVDEDNYEALLVTPHVEIVALLYGGAFSLGISFRKPMTDPLSRERYSAGNWHYQSVGTHANNPDFTLSWVSKLLDEFLTQYLQVNEEACD